MPINETETGKSILTVFPLIFHPSSIIHPLHASGFILESDIEHFPIS